MDDAFSVKKCDGKYYIYVHISDTTEYIYPEHESFEEIMKKGNTIYGLDYNWPMISRNLAENICSILPNKITYTITNEYLYENGTIKHIDYYYSEIISKRQYTYEEVDNIIIKGTNDDIMILLESSKIIEQKLNTIIINNSGSESKKIIENWMIYTNNIVGNIISRKNSGIYRFHPKPYNNQLMYLKRFVTNIFKEPIPQNFDRIFIANILKNNIDKITEYSLCL